MWFLILSAGVIFGFGMAACLTAASRADESMRRCKNCRHAKPVPERAPYYFKEGFLDCAACRGEDFDFPKEEIGVSLVRPEGFCDEFCEKEG